MLSTTDHKKTPTTFHKNFIISMFSDTPLASNVDQTWHHLWALWHIARTDDKARMHTILQHIFESMLLEVEEFGVQRP